MLCETLHKPNVAVLLVQKEVAERVTARPGDMAALSVLAQFYYEALLGQVVPAKLFSPPPKVDSQILILHKRQEPLFVDVDYKQFFRIVKAGFGERRKKLRSSLSGGLGVSKPRAEAMLQKAGIDPNRRAQELSLDEWHKLYEVLNSK
jgi:16S rRNA (adenine1518-N6/adenine1519-N6)-dimethyltransferase